LKKKVKKTKKGEKKMKISGSGRLSAGKINDHISASGSVKINGDFECKGFRSSGSLRALGNLTVIGDIKSSGSFRVMGALHGHGNAKFSGSTTVEGDIEIKGVDGSTTIKGDISGDNVYIGVHSVSIGRKKYRRPYIVDGNIFAANDVEINYAFVQGDVKGRNVKIGERTEISGKVYYIDNIVVDAKATLAHDPIQITEIAEDNLEK
jgi:cytoskeletal protein CcmA (bactofilin family)